MPKFLEVRRTGKRQRKASKKFVKLVESVKIRLNEKTIITRSIKAVERWRVTYPDLQIIS